MHSRPWFQADNTSLIISQEGDFACRNEESQLIIILYERRRPDAPTIMMTNTAI